MNLAKYGNALLIWKQANTRCNKSTIAHLLKTNPSDDVIVAKGWIRRYRSQKQAVFCQLGDGLSPDVVQIVFDKAKFGNLTELAVGSALQVTGKLVKSPGRQQNVELLADDIQWHTADPHNPFHCKTKMKPSTLRLMQHLRPKSDHFASLLRIRSSVKQFLHNYLQDQNYVQIDTPIITSNDCEGAGSTFIVQRSDEAEDDEEEAEDSDSDEEEHTPSPYFFGRPVCLTVSAQLHLEAIASGISRVYTFNPTFRAEKSRSRHHLAEFYMLEAELAFCQDLDQLMQIVENIVKETARHVSINHDKEMANFKANNVEREKGLSRDQELAILEHCANKPVFVTHYPAKAKPFYMKANDDNNAECFDLLLPGLGEVCGGSLREDNGDILRQRIINMGMSNSLDWYIDLRGSGHAPLGGFGLGFERLLQYLLGISTVRDCIPFPRWFKRCSM